MDALKYKSLRESVPLLPLASSRKGPPKSAVGQLFDAFSVNDRRFYNENSLSWQLYLLWFFEMVFLVFFIMVTVECVPLNAYLVKRSGRRGYDVVPYVNGTMEATPLDPAYVNSNCESEIKDRGTGALLVTLLYLLVLAALLFRNGPYIDEINNIVSGAIAEKRTEELDDGPKHKELMAIRSSFLKYKYGCLVFFVVSAISLTTWILILGFTRTKPQICGYEAESWQVGPDFQAYRCVIHNTMLLKSAMVLVFLFRCTLFATLLMSVRSLNQYFRTKPFLSESSSGSIESIGNIIAQKGNEAWRSVENILSGESARRKLSDKLGLLRGESIADFLKKSQGKVDEQMIREIVEISVQSVITDIVSRKNE